MPAVSPCQFTVKGKPLRANDSAQLEAAKEAIAPSARWELFALTEGKLNDTGTDPTEASVEVSQATFCAQDVAILGRRVFIAIEAARVAKLWRVGDRLRVGK